MRAAEERAELPGPGAPPASAEPSTAPVLVQFVLRLGWALHRQGAPAHRLELVLGRVSAALGLEANFFVVPTALIASFGRVETQRTYLVRIEPSELDLTKQVELDRIADAVVRRALTPSEALARIEAIVVAPARYGRALAAVCFGGASFAAARFFGGGLRELAVATGVGLALGAVAPLALASPRWARVFAPAAAVGASIAAPLGSLVVGPLSPSVVVLAGLIVLVPGLSVTVALTELTTRHLVSGTGRLLGALTDFLIMGFGVLLGMRLTALFPSAVGPPVSSAPAWTEPVALGVGLASFVVLFRVPARESPWSVAIGAAVYGVMRQGGAVFGPDLGIAAAALAAGVVSNLYANLRDRPASIVLVPSLMLLVPGSFGFRSIVSLLESNVISGVETAFRMGMVATSLVTGLLVANLLVPPRRAL